MMRMRQREFRMRWCALLSGLLHVLPLLTVNVLLTPARGPYPPQDKPPIRVFFPSTDQIDETMKAEVSSENPSPEQELDSSKTSLVPESRASSVPKEEPAAEASMVQKSEAAQPPDPRPPTSNLESIPPISQSPSAVIGRRKDTAPRRAPTILPQVQPSIQEQSEVDRLARLPKATEHMIEDVPDQDYPPDLSSGQAAVLAGSGPHRRYDRVPLLNGNDLDKYAQLPAAQQGRNFKSLSGLDTVISLNTKDIRYLSYFAHIKHKIEQVWIYPAEAVSGRLRGQLLLLFVLQRSGQVKRIDLLRSSGSKVLDKEAWDAVTNAAPFDPFPPQIPQEELQIRARFSYVLEPAQRQTSL
jgi:TonB family protein